MLKLPASFVAELEAEALRQKARQRDGNEARLQVYESFQRDQCAGGSLPKDPTARIVTAVITHFLRVHQGQGLGTQAERLNVPVSSMEHLANYGRDVWHLLGAQRSYDVLFSVIGISSLPSFPEETKNMQTARRAARKTRASDNAVRAELDSLVMPLAAYRDSCGALVEAWTRDGRLVLRTPSDPELRAEELRGFARLLAEAQELVSQLLKCVEAESADTDSK